MGERPARFQCDDCAVGRDCPVHDAHRPEQAAPPAEPKTISVIERRLAGGDIALDVAPANACSKCGGAGMVDVRHSDRLCPACDGSGTAPPADDVRARVTSATFEAMRGYIRRGTHSDWRDPLLHAIDQAERCAELERRARDVVEARAAYSVARLLDPTASEARLILAVAALAELLGTEEA